KPFGLVEVGPSTTNGQYDYAALVNTILQNFPKTIMFVPWNDGWSPVKNQNAAAAFNNGSVINLGDISISW
ncbi:TPA: beta-mannosidase, partial [Klebsiella pneumoniae]|nr:beta-mannosidase [Klebsiella pneumoniae]